MKLLPRPTGVDSLNYLKKTLIYPALVFGLLSFGSCGEKSDLERVDTNEFVDEYAKKYQYHLNENTIEDARIDLLSATNLIKNNSYLQHLYKKRTDGKGLDDGIELALAVTESNGEENAKSRWANGRLQITPGAQKDVLSEIKKLIVADKETGKKDVNASESEYNEAIQVIGNSDRNLNNEVVGLLYYCKMLYLLKNNNYFQDNNRRDNMNKLEHYKMAYFAYNSGLGRIPMLFEKEGLDSCDDFEDFVVRELGDKKESLGRWRLKKRRKNVTADDENKDSRPNTKLRYVESLSGDVGGKIYPLKNTKISLEKLREALRGGLKLEEVYEVIDM